MEFRYQKVLKFSIFQISLILILTAIAYFNFFKIPFIWDDEVQVVGNQFVTNPGFFKEIFTSSVMKGGSGPGGGSFYRPLVVLFYRWQYILFGLNSAGFHLVSLLFHFLNIILIYSLVKKITQRHFPKLVSLSPFLASLIWALHPINIEAVSWIAVQGDLIATSAVLGAFLFLLSWAEKDFQKWKQLIFAQLLFCLALFCKEPIIVFPLIFLLYLIFFYSHKSRDRAIYANIIYSVKKNISAFLKFIFTSGLAVAIYAFFRFLIAKIYFGSTLSLIGKVSKIEQIFTDITSLGSYFKLILFPSSLVSDRTFIISKISDYRFIFSFIVLAFLIFLFVKFYRKNNQIISFLGLWFFIGIFPTFNFLFPSDPAMAERYLYFPAIGLMVLLGWGLVWLFQKLPKRFKILLIFLLLINFGFWGYKIWTRNQEWINPLKFYQHDAELSPNSFLLQTNLGVEYFRNKNFGEAEQAFRRAIEIEPAYGVSHNNLGVILKQKGKTEEAVSEYKKSIALSNYYLAYINLSEIYFAEKNYKEAISLLEKASGFFPHNPAILSYLAATYWQTEDFEKAQVVALQLLEINPNDELAQTILQK